MGLIGSKVIEVKGQIYVFFFLLVMFFFLFVPLLLPGPSPNFRILAGGVHFLKVKVIEVKGQISVSRQSLVRFA